MNRNPFRKEGDAFYVLLVVGAAALAVIAVTAVLGGEVGAILGLILICVAIVIVFRWTREAIGSDEE